MAVVDYRAAKYYHPPYICHLAHLFRLPFLLAVSVLRAGIEAMDLMPCSLAQRSAVLASRPLPIWRNLP